MKPRCRICRLDIGKTMPLSVKETFHFLEVICTSLSVENKSLKRTRLFVRKCSLIYNYILAGKTYIYSRIFEKLVPLSGFLHFTLALFIYFLSIVGVVS